MFQNRLTFTNYVYNEDVVGQNYSQTSSCVYHKLDQKSIILKKAGYPRLCNLIFAGELLITILGCSRRVLGVLFIILQNYFTNGRRAINNSPQLHLRRAVASDRSRSPQKAKPDYPILAGNLKCREFK